MPGRPFRVPIQTHNLVLLPAVSLGQEWLDRAAIVSLDLQRRREPGTRLDGRRKKRGHRHARPVGVSGEAIVSPAITPTSSGNIIPYLEQERQELAEKTEYRTLQVAFDHTQLPFSRKTWYNRALLECRIHWRTIASKRHRHTRYNHQGVKPWKKCKRLPRKSQIM